MDIYRCRKCRQDLEVQNAVIKEIDGCTDLNSSQSNVLYLDLDSCPPWIVESVKQASWIKGKLLCMKCRGRLGSFDFVNQKYCRCKQHTIPVIHLLKDRVDEVHKRDSISQLSQRSHYIDVKSQKTAIASLCSDSGDGLRTAPGDCKTDDSETEPVREDLNNDHQNNRNPSEDLEFDCLDINDGHAENCCGQVDSFDDVEETGVENLSNFCDWSEVGVSDYNKFNVLSVEENEHDTGEGRTIVSPEEKEEESDIPTEFTCAVCLEMFYRPHRCEPCGHIFCEHCLRQVCRQTPTFTPCPLCRNIICKCIFQNDLTEHIKTQFEKHCKERRHETRKKRDNYPLPGCTPSQYERYLHRHGGQNSTMQVHRNEQNIIITGCFQEILVRFAWLLLLFLLHNLLFHLDNWFRWDVYAQNFVNFNYFLLTLTCKLVLFGSIYCVKKYFYINMESQFMGQAVVFVFIFSVLWDSNSWIQFALNMIVLGSLFL